MLHTKPQGHWPFGSGEEDFWSVFTIYGHGGHLGHVTQTPRTNFRSPIPLKHHMKFGFDWPSGFGEEDLWKVWTDGRTTDDRPHDGPWLYYKFTNEPKGSGELKCNSLLHLFNRIKCYLSIATRKLFFNANTFSILITAAQYGETITVISQIQWSSFRKGQLELF